MMIRKNSYGAFTLVEMLIVMGILIVLMVIGITAGRFAINRANDVAHQNAADQIYQGLQAYYTDNRVYPGAAECGVEGCTVESLMGDVANPGILGAYLDSGAFNGGTKASFFYFVDGDNQQTVLVCVTLGGTATDTGQLRGVYCNGNGFGAAGLVSGQVVSEKSMMDMNSAVVTAIIEDTDARSDWDGKTWGSGGAMPE